MTLSFNGQSVCITGKRLRELALALQRTAVEWVREQPNRFQAIDSGNGAFVESIQIVERTSSLEASKEDG